MKKTALAPHLLFFYAFDVKKSLRFCIVPKLQELTWHFLLLHMALVFVFRPAMGQSRLQPLPEAAPVVTKVEPPTWWVGLTPEVMLLLSGRNLDATHVTCNLPTIRVSRTEATAGGTYLFVWLKIGADTKSGTAVCRITTPTGASSFELPLALRSPTADKSPGLSQNDVIYLIMPDRFANGDPTNDEPVEARGSLDRSKPRAYHGGDLRGIREPLFYLKDLGVTTLWLTPILKNAAAQDFHGYGAVDLYAVEPHLGTLKDYQDLVAAAHEQRIKILFDAVPNHVGPRHPWVSNPPLPDWFHGTVQQHSNSAASINKSFYGTPEHQAISNDPFEVLVDPHAPPALSRSLTEGWFAGVLPDLNTENFVVAQYLLQNSIWWVETSGLDGYRLDTFPYIPRKFWANWHTQIRQIYPYLTTIGEVFHPDPSVTSFFAGGQRRYDGIDTRVTTLLDFPMFFVLRDVLLRGAPVGRIADVLRHDSLYPHPDLLVSFFANHDVPRFASAEGSSPAKLRLAFGLALTLRGIPEIYYGDEIGMPGAGDPDNRRDVPGGWADDSPNAFVSEGRTPEEQQTFSFVQTLLRVRREHPALRRGRLWNLASDESSYVYLRETEDEQVVLGFNNSNRPRELHIPLKDTPAQAAVGLATVFGEAPANISGKELILNMPAQTFSIFLLN